MIDEGTLLVGAYFKVLMFMWIRKKIDDIPEERRHHLLSLLNPRFVCWVLHLAHNWKNWLFQRLPLQYKGDRMSYIGN